MYDHDHKFGSNGIEPGFKTSPIVIGRNTWIGAGTIVLCGTHVGEGCVIGAGCILRGTIPPYSRVTSRCDLSIVPLSSSSHK